MKIKIMILIAALLFSIPLTFTQLMAQDTGEQEENIGDIDPTRPIVFNLREEFYNLKGGVWKNALILRTDVIKLSKLRNLLLRVDLPVVSADVGQGTEHGLGDIYGQFLLIPYTKHNFFLAAGSGIILPTATEKILGNDKWQIAPMVIPGLRFRDPRGIFFVKIQDFVSFAGQSDRSDIHYMTLTPLFLMKVHDRWWAGVDTEAKINWQKDNESSFKTGFFLLRMWTKGFGTWVKPEIPWGPNREADWAIKVSLFWHY